MLHAPSVSYNIIHIGLHTGSTSEEAEASGLVVSVGLDVQVRYSIDK